MSTTTMSMTLARSVTAQLQEYVDEVNAGPDKGGISGQVRVGENVVELSASRGWGVFVATASGTSEHVPGPAISTEQLGAVITRLLAA